MSDGFIREIAQRMADKQLNSEFLLMLGSFLLPILGGGVASYLGAYAKKRGESYATKSDFEEILKRLKTTTELSESIKAKVSHTDWANREFKTLKREKLEELMQSVQEAEAWLHACEIHYIFNSADNPATSPAPKIESLTTLYFSEMDAEVGLYLMSCKTAMSNLLSARQSILKASQDLALVQQEREKFFKISMAEYGARLEKKRDLEKKARQIMHELIEFKKD